METVTEKTIDQITVDKNGIVLFREANVVTKNGVEISKSYHRSSVVPGQDLANIPQEVSDFCMAAWTPEIIAAYERLIADMGV